MALVKNMQYVIWTCGKYHASKNRRQMQDIQCRLSQLRHNSELSLLSQSDEIDTLQCFQELQNQDHKKAIRARFLYLCQSLKEQTYRSKESFKQLHSKLTRNAMAFSEFKDGTMVCKGMDMLKECFMYFGHILSTGPLDSNIQNYAINLLLKYV